LKNVFEPYLDQRQSGFKT